VKPYLKYGILLVLVLGLLGITACRYLNDQPETTTQSPTTPNPPGTPAQPNHPNPSNPPAEPATPQNPEDLDQFFADVYAHLITGHHGQPADWHPVFLDTVDMASVYQAYLADGGTPLDLGDFAFYLTDTAPQPANWKALATEAIKQASGGFVVSDFEQMGDYLYRAILIQDGRDGEVRAPFADINSRTGQIFWNYDWNNPENAFLDQAREYLLANGWVQNFLDGQNLPVLYESYKRNGGNAEDVEAFGNYVTNEAPILETWQDLFNDNLYANFGYTASRIEPLEGSTIRYQAYVIIDGTEREYVVVNARTGYFHG